MSQLNDIQMQQILQLKEEGYLGCNICYQKIKTLLDIFLNNKSEKQTQTENGDEDIVIELFDPIDPQINQVENYFEKFLTLIIKKDFLHYAICFYLGRIGKSIKEISCIKLKQIEREIRDVQENQHFTHLHSLGKKIHSILNNKFSSYVYLFQQPYLPGRLDKGLRQLRQLMENEYPDNEWKQFLKNLKIKSLNKVFNKEKKHYSQNQKKKPKIWLIIE